MQSLRGISGTVAGMDAVFHQYDHAEQNNAAAKATERRRHRQEELYTKGGTSAPVSSDSSPSESDSNHGDSRSGVGGVGVVVGCVDPPTVSTIRPVEQPAVLVNGDAPYCIVDANEEWLTACSYSSVDQVIGQTLSIIQGPQVSALPTIYMVAYFTRRGRCKMCGKTDQSLL